jgi:hypothetical protein
MDQSRPSRQSSISRKPQPSHPSPELAPESRKQQHDKRMSNDEEAPGSEVASARDSLEEEFENIKIEFAKRSEHFNHFRTTARRNFRAVLPEQPCICSGIQWSWAD